MHCKRDEKNEQRGLWAHQRQLIVDKVINRNSQKHNDLYAQAEVTCKYIKSANSLYTNIVDLWRPDQQQRSKRGRTRRIEISSALTRPISECHATTTKERFKFKRRNCWIDSCWVHQRNKLATTSTSKNWRRVWKCCKRSLETAQTEIGVAKYDCWRYQVGSDLGKGRDELELSYFAAIASIFKQRVCSLVAFMTNLFFHG